MKDNGDVALHVSLPKYMQRYISGVRDFPPRCGRIPTANIAISSLNGGNKDGHVKESETEAGLVTQSSNLVKTIAPEIDKQSNQSKLASPKRTDLQKSVAGCFPPRRRVSAIRDFPPHCGRNAESRGNRKRMEVLNSSKSGSSGQETDARALNPNKAKKKMKETVEINTKGSKRDIGEEDVDMSMAEDQFQDSRASELTSQRRAVMGKKASKADLARGASKSSGKKHHSLLLERLQHDVNPNKIKAVKPRGGYASSSTRIASQVSSEVSHLLSRPASSISKNSDSGVGIVRTKVMETLRLFQDVYGKLLQEAKAEGKAGEAGHRRFDLKAAGLLKDNGKYVNTGEQIMGPVPGVEIGDEFQYRIELNVIGLHRQIQGGIDYVKQNGTPLAVSVVASGGYENELDSDVLIYTGSGGTDGNKKSVDQKLERGNLALTNSKRAGNPVRVIRGEDSDAKGRVYVYDGLYLVEDYWKHATPQGNKLFKFRLRRIPGQPKSNGEGTG